MKYKKLRLCASLLVTFGLSNGYAQEAVTASGGDASGSGGLVAYSVGQICYSSQTGSNGNINQGVEQPYEISTVGINETEFNISVSVFPNPTVNNITLQVNDFNNKKLIYQFLDVQGKVLESNSINTALTQINTNNLPSGNYFLNISEENKTIQSFKIIKN